MTPQQHKILEVLSDGEIHTTKEIADITRIGYPPRRICEMRKMGFVIEGVKGKHWEEYRLISSPSLTAQETAPTAKIVEEEQAQLFEVKNSL